METVNYSNIYVNSYKYFPRSKTYDVVWRSGGDIEYKVEYLWEDDLVEFIKEEGLMLVNYYHNVTWVEPLKYLEENEGEVIKSYLEKYYL